MNKHYGYAAKVSYGVAFRLVRILIGAALRVLMLKVVPSRPKIPGVTIMVIGLLLVALDQALCVSASLDPL